MTYTPKLYSRIIVTSADQLEGTLSSDAEYLIDGSIDLGSISIEIPLGGLTISGLNFFVSKLYSTADNHVMFDGSNPDGNVIFKDLELSCSGINSKLFDVDNEGNNSSFEFIDCNIGSFDRLTTSFGTVANYRQVRFDGCGFINYSDGITFNGTFSGGIAVSDSIILSASSGSSLFKEGTSLIFQGSSISNINASSGSNSANSVVYDFQPSNYTKDEGFLLIDARFGLLTNPVPNLPESSTKVFFRVRESENVRNTYPGYEMDFASQVTTPLILNVPAKALGTTAINNAQWWSQTANNEATYLADSKKDFKVTINVTVDGGPNDNISLIVRQWDNSASSYIDLKTRTRSISNVVGGSDIATYSFVTRGEFDINDRIELWLENMDDNTDVTVLQDISEVFVESI